MSLSPILSTLSWFIAFQMSEPLPPLKSGTFSHYILYPLKTAQPKPLALMTSHPERQPHAFLTQTRLCFRANLTKRSCLSTMYGNFLSYPPISVSNMENNRIAADTWHSDSKCNLCSTFRRKYVNVYFKGFTIYLPLKFLNYF